MPAAHILSQNSNAICAIVVLAVFCDILIVKHKKHFQGVEHSFPFYLQTSLPGDNGNQLPLMLRLIMKVLHKCAVVQSNKIESESNAGAAGGGIQSP